MEKTIFPMQRKTLENETKRGGNRFKNSASLIRVQCKLDELHCSMSECWCIGRSGSIFPKKKKKKERKKEKKEKKNSLEKRICMKFLDDSITMQNNVSTSEMRNMYDRHPSNERSIVAFVFENDKLSYQ